jgi:tetratricopeptide (TPR) repeat protein
MQIIHRFDDFLYTLFPDLVKGNMHALITRLTDYYTYGPYKPKVSVSEEWVKIEIDTPAIFSQDSDYRKVAVLCEKGRYSEAKPILTSLIDKNPSVSEYHRILGQVLSDEGNQEEAINCLIDALRWDSTNSNALVMLGNIFAKFKNDVPTAMKYFDQALIVNPKDHIAANNIGANLIQQGKLEEAKKYLLQAMQISSTYPNTHFTLGLLYLIGNDFASAFFSTVQAIKCNNNRDILYQSSFKQALAIAARLVSMPEGMQEVRNYLCKLELESAKDIDLVEDTAISSATKFELAENYFREKHIIKYKPSYPAKEHLIFHELVHLDFILRARKKEINRIFVSSPDRKRIFITNIETSVKKLQKLGLSESAVSQFCTSLFDGMNLQAYNTPIDLFIEDFIFSGYAAIRPYQFLSLYNMVTEGIKAVTDKHIVDVTPCEILSKSKIYHLVIAMQFRALFGIDLLNNFQASSSELKIAQAFYDEYLQYKDDLEPGQEYELVRHWAEDLKLGKYFELIDENEYRNK